ncbi:helix-turn-helix domain-containing protein [Negativibacillus massiliensis]|uniref:helix-turn-helix domain-containing protein n=1 Tax=Negativibacillus massiliensis TaxID=1871035 RepID=UPI000978930B|nr:helix-turn-helix transcriptional regulator [Negativibacillus massiliensis]
MEQLFIGELIRQRRLELGLKQCELCEGICEPVTMSRLESGKQTPGSNKLRMLMQRLGLPEERYYALVSKNELRISELQTEIVSSNVLHDSLRGLEKIEELEAIAEPNDNQVRQFILRSRAILGKLVDGKVEPYSLEEKLEMLFEAIRLTSPYFDIDHIGKGLYCIDEVKVINQIANIYSKQGKREQALQIFVQLIEYIKQHFHNVKQSGGLLPLVSFNYARELDLDGQYEKAIEVAHLGWESCVQYGQYATLPSSIEIIAECYHFLGDDEKSKDYYKQAYYIYKAIGDSHGLDSMKTEIAKYFGSDFQL